MSKNNSNFVVIFFLLLISGQLMANDCQYTDDQLRKKLSNIYLKAIEIAGSSNDIFPRSNLFHSIYLDSKKQFRFIILALHAAHQIEDDMISSKAWWRNVGEPILGNLKVSQDGIRLENAIVQNQMAIFIEHYTIYRFSKMTDCFPKTQSIYLEQFDENKLVVADAFNHLVHMHIVNELGLALNSSYQCQFLEDYARFEQVVLIDDRIQKAYSEMGPMGKKIFKTFPKGKFPYFKNGEVIRYNDFFSVEDRIDATLKAYDLAEEAGWKTVEASIRLKQNK